MEENTLLQRGQRIEILYVGSPARDVDDDTVDLRLGQLHQRQHLGCDMFTALRDQVLRDRDEMLLASCSQGKRCQGGCCKDRPYIDLQACPAHPLDQGYGEQGVAAESEEVIVTSDLVEL